MSLLKKLFTPNQPAPLTPNQPAPPPVLHLYVPGRLSGQPMDPVAIASAIQANQQNLGLQGAVQVVEAYAVEALGLATQEHLIHNGMASHYLMVHSWLSNLLADLEGYRQGQLPDVPVRQRVQPKPRQHDN